MASTPDNLYVTYVDVDHGLLKIWGQRNRIGATYIERQLIHLRPEFNRTLSPNPAQIHKGMFCFAKYTDDNYYRARIISRVQGDSVGVLFVDYGNRDIIKLSNIRIQEGNEGHVLAKMSEQAEEYFLARVGPPVTGWTKEIVSEIRRDICYEEFFYQIVAQVEDQKILQIQFHNEDFSNYLVKKQLASPLSLPVQREMILSYGSFSQSSDAKSECLIRNTPRVTFSPSMPPPNIKTSIRLSNATNEGMMQSNDGKANSPLSHSSPVAQYSSPRHISSTFQHMNQNIPKNTYFSSANSAANQIPINSNSLQQLSSDLNPLLNSQLTQLNALHLMKENAGSYNTSHNIIQILAQQVKQYIDEDNAKTESDAEKIPHHYINSVLEVGNTYNVIVSYTEDGPWSFSIQLLSSETELQELMDELSSTELVPIKPPIILGHPCIASSALYGNLCRGVVVSLSRSAVKVYFVDFGNTEDLPSSSIYELPPKFFKIRVLSQKFSLSGLQKVVYSDDIKKFFKEVVQDELLILRVTSLEGDNLPTCELYLKDKNIKRILNDKIRELRTTTMEEFPKVGDTENVVVTWVVSPQKFFVQLNKRDPDLKALKKELAKVETKGQRLTYQQLSVGFKCVCQYKSDGQWYRAVITSVDSENAITVFYVDYGNTETVDISLLRRIDSSSLINQMSNQAIQCSLKGYENKSFDQALSKRLETLALEKEFLMSIVASDKELLCVQLFDNGKDISSLLSTISPESDFLESSSFTNDVWSSVSAESNTFDREKNLMRENGESYEKKDSKYFRSEKTRFENKESWRNDKDRQNHWNEQKLDNQTSWKPRGFKQSKENEVLDNNNNSNNNTKIGGYKWPKQEKGRDIGSGNAKFERNRAFKQTKAHDGLDNRKENSFGERKKFDENRSAKEKFAGRKFGAKEGKRFNRNRTSDWSRNNDDPKKKFDRNDKNFAANENPRSLIKFVRKEDAAPPGTKFEKMVIYLGSKENGIVTYYFSPDEFYVQLLAQEEEFKKMMTSIQTYYSQKYPLRDPVTAGDIVIAQFTVDKVLYRAEVIKPSPVTVRYVDYGNQEPVGSKGIWLVHKQFLKLPMQVIKCKLSNVQPIGSDWPPPGSAVDKFFESSEYKCTFLSCEKDMYEIAMEDVKTGKDVASEIIAAGLGRPLETQLDIPEIDYSLLSNQILRLYISHVESSSEFYVIMNPRSLELIENKVKTYCENKNNLVPFNGDWTKPLMPCLATNDDVSWNRGNILKAHKNKNLIWFMDRGDTVEVTADRVMNIPCSLQIFQAQAVKCSLHGVSGVDNEKFKNMIKYKHYLVSIVSVRGESLSVVLYGEDGQKLDFQKCCDSPQAIEPIGHFPVISQKVPIVISHIETPKEIHVSRSADRDELTNFSDLLSNFYSKENEDFELEEERIPGTLVAAKSVIYHTWYRGRVTSLSEKGVEVLYIDFGNKEILPRENLKKLDPSFFSLNAFSKKLILDVEYDAKNTEEINNWFLRLCQDKNILAYFKNNQGEFISEFIIDGKRASHLLESAGFVSLNKPDKFTDILLDKEMENKTQRNAEEISQDDDKLDDLKVLVSHIDCPKKFWVHKESTINELHRFQDKLQKSCEILPDKKSVQVGDIVGVKFSDTLWYRAKVKIVENKKATVQLIDYGNTFTADLDCDIAKELTNEFLKIPAFAIPLALGGAWNNNATAKFEEIILQNEDPVSVMVLEESEDPVLVDLLQKGQSIAEMLIEEGVALEGEQDDSDVCIVYVTHCESPNDFYVQKEICTDILNNITERLLDVSSFNTPSFIEENEIYAAKLPFDETWYRAKIIRKLQDGIEVHFIDYGNKSKVTEIKCLPNDLRGIPGLAENCSLLYGNNCDTWSEEACRKFPEYTEGRGLKMKVVINRINKPVVKLFYKYRSITELLEPFCENDGRVDVYISHVVSPTEFYIQLVEDKNYKLVTEALESESDCEDLEDRTPGTLCQALFADDNYYYRAKVIKDLEDGCEVYFIDYGNVSVSKEVKKLPEKAKEIPPVALKCRLNLPENNISESAKKEFFSLTTCGASVFRARIISPGEVNIISLKLEGRILEETLNVCTVPEENGNVFSGDHNKKDLSSFDNRQTDDENSEKIIISDNYFLSNVTYGSKDKMPAGITIEEEKRGKIDVNKVEECDEGSLGNENDEEEIKENLPAGFIHETDNEFMKENWDINEVQIAFDVSSEDSRENLLETAELSKKAEENIENVAKIEDHSDESEELEEQENRISDHPTVNIINGIRKSLNTLNGNVGSVNNPQKGSKSRIHNVMSSCILEKQEEIIEASGTSYKKLNFSEKLVPGSISRGVSFESVIEEQDSTEAPPEKHTSKSAPNTPKLERRIDKKNQYMKMN